MIRPAPKLRIFFQKPAATAVILFLVCLLTYGLYLPWMGFYWDDWPWIWQFHVYGPQAIREIDAAFRPLAGVVLWLGTRLAGTDATRWQTLQLHAPLAGEPVTMVGSAPNLAETARHPHLDRHPVPGVYRLWAAICVHQQQPAPFPTNHLFPFTRVYRQSFPNRTTLCEFDRSGGGTFPAHHVHHGILLWPGACPGCYLGTFGKPTPESYALKSMGHPESLAPYLLLLAAVFAWRFAASQQINYQVVVVDQLAASPLLTLVDGRINRTGRSLGGQHWGLEPPVRLPISA